MFFCLHIGYDCGFPIHLQYGLPVTLESPNYPSNYYNNADCSWTVNAPAAETIFVNFIAFSLEEGYDYLYVGGNKYTGTSLPADFSISANSLVIRFQSDATGILQGFQLRLEICMLNIEVNALVSKKTLLKIIILLYIDIEMIY